MNILQKRPKNLMKKSTGFLALGVLTGVSLILAGALTANMIVVGAGAALILFTCGMTISRRSQTPVSYV
jgi:hypothetical protein